MPKLLAAICLCLVLSTIRAQQPDPAQANADHANQLIKENRLVEALPLYQELAKAFPRNLVYQERLVVCLSAKASQTTDPAALADLRTQIRDTSKSAMANGLSSPLFDLGAKIDPSAPADPITPAKAVMKQAESAFASGDLSTAMTKYTEAAALDPQLYEAPLYAGDTAYKQHDVAAALKWYARAIAVNPNRETAYRYRGDQSLRVALAVHDDPASIRYQALDSGARRDYIDAIVAEPYNRLAWSGIANWVKAKRGTIQIPKIDRPALPAPDPNKPDTVVLPASTPSASSVTSQAWMTYSLVRAAYRKDTFNKDFPEEKQYRHTLKEESSALTAVAAVLKDKPVKPEDLDESLRNLVALSDAGMLDCWILINGADQGIAQDYNAYRNQHRKLLHDYLDRFVIHPAQPAAPAGTN